MTNPSHLPSLSEEEKLQQRAALLSYMHEHPLIPQRKSFFQTMQFVKIVAPISTLMIVILTLGGVTYAAESSLPGDTLYPIKVNVTEPLRTILKTTPEARTSWQLQLVDRRLAEARTLITLDRLNQTAEDALLTSLSKRQMEIQQTVAQLEANDHDDLADELQIHLQGTIAGEHSILNTLSEHNNKREKITPYIQAIEKISTSSPNTIQATTTDSSIDDLLQVKKIEKRKEKLFKDIEKTTKTQGRFGQQATSSQLYLRGQESLKQAQERLRNADDAFEKGDFKESERQYRQAQVETEKAQHIFQTLPLLERYNKDAEEKINLERD